jgi:hypothetical protein
MLPEDDGTWRWQLRRAVYALFCHGVKLLELSSLPICPVWELAEFTTRETAKCLLRGSATNRGVERSDEQEAEIVTRNQVLWHILLVVARTNVVDDTKLVIGDVERLIRAAFM